MEAALCVVASGVLVSAMTRFAFSSPVMGHRNDEKYNLPVGCDPGPTGKSAKTRNIAIRTGCAATRSMPSSKALQAMKPTRSLNSSTNEGAGAAALLEEIKE